MHLKRTSILAIAVSVIIMASLPGVPAGHEDNLTTEWYPYIANDLVIGVAVTPCDTEGVGGVLFCATLQNATTRPDRLEIDIRDDAGPRVTGYYMFSDANGSALPASQGGQGYFCGAINHFVHPKAVDLLVFVTPIDLDAFIDFALDALFWTVDTVLDTLLDEDEAGDLDASGAACGSPGTAGKVTVVWRYNAPVPFP